ncbi:putative PEP-binding protein [Kangsaoukella pontilimi]|nr:putative PEP-binding protein [Kangsaoukella pontilimi]
MPDCVFRTEGVTKVYNTGEAQVFALAGVDPEHCAKELSVLLGRHNGPFDGFYIGSNDLTQRRLGLDSDKLAPILNERHPAPDRMIRTVIAKAHEHGTKVGLCGQAPSNHPEVDKVLVDAGIASISVTPDAPPERERPYGGRRRLVIGGRGAANGR